MVYCIGKKNSLIKSSLLNIAPDFNFHLLFYCFSPCPVSLPHMFNVFKPPSTTSTASFPAVVWWGLLWGFHAYVVTFGQSIALTLGSFCCLHRVSACAARADEEFPQQPFYLFLESFAGSTRRYRALVSHMLLELLLKVVQNHRKAEADLKWGDLEIKQPVLLLTPPRAGCPGPYQLGFRFLHRQSLCSLSEKHMTLFNYPVVTQSVSWCSDDPIASCPITEHH